MFSRGKLLCKLATVEEQVDQTSGDGLSNKYDFLQRNLTLHGDSPRTYNVEEVEYQRVDQFTPLPEVFATVVDDTDEDTQPSNSNLLTDISSNVLPLPDKIATVVEAFNENTCPSISSILNDTSANNFVPSPKKNCVIDASDEETKLSKSGSLIDIVSINEVPDASKSYHLVSVHSNSEEDFSPSDEDYVPDTNENSPDHDFPGRSQIFVPETSCSSLSDNEVNSENRLNTCINPFSMDVQTISLSSSSESRGSRKRKRNICKWKCNVRKLKAVTGKSYTSKKGKVVPEKKMKPVCDCRLKCSERVDETARAAIFQKYYSKEMTWNLKRQFTISMVTEIETARSRRRDPEHPPKRSFTLNYTFLVNDKPEKICKKFFLNTLAISETVVRNAIKKSTHGFVQEDRRGRHPPPNKTAEAIKESIRNHIDMIPKYESHYSRNRTKRLYLGSHLNIEKLYALYVEFCAEKNIPKENVAKAWLYRHIFKNEYNLGFNPPANDTCDDCDGFVIKTKNTTDVIDKNAIKAEHDKHLQESHLRYSLKGFDKVDAIESHGSKKMLTVDLQKCLPTPYLTNSQSFYLRKLWTFNFTIMDSVAKESWCFMWDETVAGRGGNEMASGLVKFFEQLEDVRLEEVTIWSDNCAGQNKNISVMMAYLWILSNQNIKIINHKYLLKGHTHMEVDVIHSIIEREKKKIQEFPIVTPWQQFIKSCSKNAKISVVNMETDSFKEFSAFCEGLSAPFVHRKKSESGETVPYSNIVWMQFRKEHMGSMFYKTSFQDEMFSEVSFIRNKRKGFSMPTPKPIRDTLRPISKLKYNDLQKSLQWIPSMFHDFYKNLPNGDVPDLPEAAA
ncbi:unnamed protein product [Pieris macdunnoughi]|uniref:DUF7869 domain-containing protein n=1 Tax=Pieris macdunnoughi TaxID=345717 RepID=A0A821XTD6_9NEOP|nr:unnamed protein product [Pieris macdunnoughi]